MVKRKSGARAVWQRDPEAHRALRISDRYDFENSHDGVRQAATEFESPLVECVVPRLSPARVRRTAGRSLACYMGRYRSGFRPRWIKRGIASARVGSSG